MVAVRFSFGSLAQINAGWVDCFLRLGWVRKLNVRRLSRSLSLVVLRWIGLWFVCTSLWRGNSWGVNACGVAVIHHQAWAFKGSLPAINIAKVHLVVGFPCLNARSIFIRLPGFDKYFVIQLMVVFDDLVQAFTLNLTLVLIVRLFLFACESLGLLLSELIVGGANHSSTTLAGLVISNDLFIYLLLVSIFRFLAFYFKINLPWYVTRYTWSWLWYTSWSMWDLLSHIVLCNLNIRCPAKMLISCIRVDFIFHNHWIGVSSPHNLCIIQLIFYSFWSYKHNFCPIFIVSIAYDLFLSSVSILFSLEMTLRSDSTNSIVLTFNRTLLSNL